MSRTVPSALQTHLNQAATTTTRLLKIKLKNGAVYGLAMIDRDIAYDDGSGDGEVDYLATNGFDPSAIAADTGYSVSNSEGYALMSDSELTGITEEMVKAGECDDATWVCYLVNFEDTSMGHVILDAGDVGEVVAKYGMVWIPELLSYSMRLAQPIGSVWSRSCRAIFGTPADSPTGCGVDASTMWRYDTVAAPGAEADRVFTGVALGDSPGVTVTPPGRLQWLTGDNAGMEFAIEEVVR